MPDMTVTWPGAVPFEAAYGQSSNRNTDGKAVLFDVRAMAAKDMVIVPMLRDDAESVYKDARPYDMAGEDFDWAAEYEQSMNDLEQARKPAARKRKAG